MLLVTNASVFHVCVRMSVCVLLCVCFNCYLASESREGIVDQITLRIAAEKLSPNDVLSRTL